MAFLSILFGMFQDRAWVRWHIRSHPPAAIRTNKQKILFFILLLLNLLKNRAALHHLTSLGISAHTCVSVNTSRSCGGKVHTLLFHLWKSIRSVWAKSYRCNTYMKIHCWISQPTKTMIDRKMLSNRSNTFIMSSCLRLPCTKRITG